MEQLTVSPTELASFQTSDGEIRVDGPLLKPMTNERLIPDLPQLRGQPTVGYGVFENNILAPEWIENGRRYYDFLVTGSTWLMSGVGLFTVKGALSLAPPMLAGRVAVSVALPPTPP